MRNYALLFSFLFLFVVTDLDAQRRSGRASKRVDESKNVENVKPDELHKKYGFSSRDHMVEFLLGKDLKRSDKRIVEKLKNKPRNAFRRVSYAIYETPHNDFGFCVAHTNAIQNYT